MILRLERSRRGKWETAQAKILKIAGEKALDCYLYSNGDTKEGLLILESRFFIFDCKDLEAADKQFKYPLSQII